MSTYRSVWTWPRHFHLLARRRLWRPRRSKDCRGVAWDLTADLRDLVAIEMDVDAALRLAAVAVDESPGTDDDRQRGVRRVPRRVALPWPSRRCARPRGSGSRASSRTTGAGDPRLPGRTRSRRGTRRRPHSGRDPRPPPRRPGAAR